MKAGSLRSSSDSVPAEDEVSFDPIVDGGRLIWKLYIENGDTSGIWRRLTRLIVRHPLVRFGGDRGEGATSLPDLTQDLYLQLLGRNRFEHYVVAGLTDDEVEREIRQVELPRLMLARLRRQRPESYRLARRIGHLLSTDERFRPFTEHGVGRPGRRRSGDRFYGLGQWSDAKPIRDGGDLLQRMIDVPIARRNHRRSGRGGDSQLVISNRDLATLLTSILEAVDSPLPLRLLRQLALTRIPLHDPELFPLDDQSRGDGQRSRRPRLADTLASSESNPEAILLVREDALAARRLVLSFLDRLAVSVRQNQQRLDRLLIILWHLYFNPAEPTQVEIASFVGLSDSSIGDYRRRLEGELRRLSLAPSLIRQFAEALEEELRRRLTGSSRSA